MKKCSFAEPHKRDINSAVVDLSVLLGKLQICSYWVAVFACKIILTSIEICTESHADLYAEIPIRWMPMLISSFTSLVICTVLCNTGNKLINKAQSYVYVLYSMCAFMYLNFCLCCLFKHVVTYLYSDSQIALRCCI